MEDISGNKIDNINDYLFLRDNVDKYMNLKNKIKEKQKKKDKSGNI